MIFEDGYGDIVEVTDPDALYIISLRDNKIERLSQLLGRTINELEQYLEECKYTQTRDLLIELNFKKGGLLNESI